MNTAPETTTNVAYRTLGAITEATTTTFCVWAPERTRADLVVYETPAVSQAGLGDAVRDVRPMERDKDGYWRAVCRDLPPGTLYKIRLDGRPEETFPDPASRYQPFGVHGPSAVVDPSRYTWTDALWVPLPLDRLVIYELHVGAFTPEGTFAAARERLPYLADLGVNAIELMPLADFPGERNWGYDGVALFAPARCYGRPDDLRQLVDAAHRLGLAVLLDVVYNHLGPDGAYANAFSPYYFTDAHCSPWGSGVNLDGPHSADVRRLFLENAIHWVNEYHVDGLRLDATHAMVDDSPRHFLAELTETVHGQSRKPLLLIAEDHRNLNRLVRPVDRGGYGLDGVWADDFHHEVRVHTAGDREGYYLDFTGSIEDLARTVEQGWFYTGQYSSYLKEVRGTDPSSLDPSQFVICIQNHDQIGNRADGARLNHQIDLATYRALSVLLLLAPQTPLLFMGQEWAAGSPFQFFTDFNEDLGRRVTEGRRQEFSRFSAFADPQSREAIPDPQAWETFVRSRLDWDESVRPPHHGTRQLYARALALRHARHTRQQSRDSYTVRVLDEHTLAIDHADGALVVIARIGDAASHVSYEVRGEPSIVLTTEDADITSDRRPPSVGVEGGRVRIAFERPGAVVLRSTAP